MKNIILHIKIFFIGIWNKFYPPDESVIPTGPYCYVIDTEKTKFVDGVVDGDIYTKMCPYYKFGNSIHGCTFVGYAGWDVLLSDQCKICGVNEDKG